jgi:hypothetical protein
MSSASDPNHHGHKVATLSPELDKTIKDLFKLGIVLLIWDQLWGLLELILNRF